MAWRIKCLNCGTALVGEFCSACGQRAIPSSPTVRELAGDAFSEFSGWDGKFAQTVRLLLAKPGELTRQWIDGRRVHFISPVRLYLTASLLYFLVAAAAPNLRGKIVGVSGPAGIQVGTTVTRSRPARVADRTEAAFADGVQLTPAELAEAKADVAKAPWILRPMLEKSITEPGAMKAGIYRWLPRMLIALLPLYAGILALFYRRRHYPEHLYFAIHLHAFVFVAFAFSNLVKFTHVSPLAIAAGIASAAWIIAYALIALRRVYGGTMAANIGKAVGIMALYALVAGPALFAAVLLSAF
jgi:hypothetical protein